MRIRTQRLPTGYRELEYIESTGGQYIDSGVSATSTSGLEINYSQLLSSSAGIFGCRSTSCTFWISQQSAGNLFAFEFTGQSRITYNGCVAYNTGFHTIKIKDNKIVYDGIEKGSYVNSADGNLTIWLFRTNENGSPYSGSCYGQLKYCKIWNGNTLVRNFIPAERCSDGKPGLYDTVNDVFYINQGTNEFIKGPYKDSYQVSLNRLPIEYLELEYIESTEDGQYIDTNYTPDLTFGIDIEFAPTVAPSTSGASSKMFGSSKRNSGYWGGATLGTYATRTGGQFTWFYRSGADGIYDPKIQSTKKQRFSIINNVITYCDGTIGTITKTSVNDVYGSIYLFGIHSESEVGSAGCKIYTCKFYSNNAIVRNFIPCERKLDGKPGMYDTINSVFYYNQGNSEFIKGPYKLYHSYEISLSVLPSEYQGVEYIETSGTQFIDTLYYNDSSKIKIVTRVTSNSTSQDTPIFGSNSSTASGSNSGYLHLTPYSNKWYVGTNGSEINFGTYRNVSGLTYDVFYNVDGVIKINDQTSNTYTIKPNGTILISKRIGSTGNRSGRWKYYFFKIYDDDKLVRYMLPCYRKSDSVIGMYDIINKVFYDNDGTGDFTKGSNKTHIL